MSTTPSKPRVSGIPTPGKSSGIPTPGRLRSTSSAATSNPAGGISDSDVNFLSRTLADAIKANDPAHHRLSSGPSDVSGASLSSHAINFASGSLTSGRKSVTGSTRPSSATSSVSALSTSNKPARAKAHPPPVRPGSRTSDVFTRSVSRSGRPHEVGDDVRIQSLGFEGVLRFVGEIEGKAGLWAGVELSGGFSGKGKNNGSVNGIQYFSCPPNCGVFVALSKLSSPAVRDGRMSRPSSVASTRSGRITPSVSGRITPSVSNGRVTPSTSTGRVTPLMSGSRVTPGAKSKGLAYPRPVMITPKITSTTTISETKITPGSRASKYVGIKAHQLTPREIPVPVPGVGRRSLGSESPTRKSSAPTTSPIRSIGSPFNTPRPGLNGFVADGSPSPSKGRMSLKTPRARIPSAVAMPPPSSPSMAFSSMTISLNDEYSDSKSTSRAVGSPRPSSATSSRSTPVHELVDEMSRLQSRLDALEFENQYLRDEQGQQLNKLRELEHTVESADNSAEVEALRTERDNLKSRIVTLEGSLKTQDRVLDERDTKVQALERSIKEMTLDVSKIKSESENRLRDIHGKLDDSEALNRNLKELLDAKEGQENANGAVLAAKAGEIAVLEARIEKVYKELEEERRELGSQIDELRAAGQETIALYEERLSASETKRYDMEDQIASLEEQLRSSARPPSPGSLALYASSAAQIDNETLKDQVQHLQKKITSLEDMLEDARAASERDEAAVRERIKRYKDKEELLKKEVAESKKEIERFARAEEQAKQRLFESEEAFRENAVTLENARAEIEVLRSELVNTEDLSAGSASANTPRKVSDFASKAANERSKLVEELGSLKAKLDESFAEKESLNQMLESVKLDMELATEGHQSELGREQQVAVNLRKELEERVVELESLRKKANREVVVNNNALQDSSKHNSTLSKYDVSVSREEATGLKHIIQELQKEIQTYGQQNKILESENKLLVSEADQLRQELKVLEESVKQSLMREESALPSAQSYPEDIRQTVQELKVKYEADLEQLRKRLADSEMKNARTIHDLNKEISELESLIESKIYHEDDLERELERLKEKLSRTQKKTSRNGVETNGAPPAPHVDVCEICEQPGHDIFSCSLLKDEPTTGRGGEELICEDCEERGHVAADCPHSLDVF